MPERPLAAITGASSGIGATFARKLAARGYDLLLIARREDRLRELASDLGNADVLRADLSREADLDRVASRIASARNLALLVNNAGFGVTGNFFESDQKALDRMHRVHILATLRLTRAALGNLVARGVGGVINVSSVAAYVQTPGGVGYAATKAWISSFTEGLAMELAGRNSPVKMQALCPGFTLSEFHDTLGMDRGVIPRSWWMTSDFVVEASLRGFDRGDLFVIPGWRYKLLVGVMKALPAALIRRAAAGGARRYRKPK